MVDRELGVAAAHEHLGHAGELADEDLRCGLVEVLAEVARETRSPALAAA